MSSIFDIRSERNGSSEWRTRPVARKQKSRLNKGWVLLPLLSLIAGLAVTLLQRRPDAVSVSTEKAQIKNLVHLVSGTGKIRPEHEVKISSEVAGEIIDIPVRLGQRVKAGDLLVKIKPDNYLASVRQGEAALTAAKADSVMRKAEMVNNDLDRHRSEELFSKKLISESEYAAAETRASVARAAYESSLAQIEVAQSTLDQNKDLLQKCTIVSPADGTIDSISSESGERVVATGSFAGTEMMRIANLQSMQAWVDINENDIVKVRVGNRARVHIDAYPERTFLGVVERIAGRASVQNEGTQQEVTNFEVRVQILRPEVVIRPGMSTRVEIQTETAYQALSVPIQSVTIRDKNTGKPAAQGTDDQTTDQSSVSDLNVADTGTERVLFVVQGGSVKMARVEVGIADDNYIQIISGIRAGDEVVAGPYTAISRDLMEGTAVKDDDL
jgi:HlyD family secretion protein